MDEIPEGAERKMTKRDYQLRASPCCGVKPLIYMLPRPHQFCYRCDRTYDAMTEEQTENWAWKRDAAGVFVPTQRDGEYAKHPGRIP